MTNTKSSIYSGIKSDLIIFVLQILLSFGTIPTYLYFMGIDEFGFYIAVQSVIALISLADIGLGQYVVKKLANNKYYNKHAFMFLPSIQVFQYLLAGCLFLIGIISFYFVSTFLNVNESLKEEVSWLFLFSWCAVSLKIAFALIPSVLRAKSLFAYLNIINFLTLLFSIIINIVFLSLGYGLASLGLSLLIANIVAIFVMYFRLNKETVYRFLLPIKFNKIYVQEGWSYIRKFQLLKIGHVAKSSLFVVLLTKFSGAPVVAVYNITNKMPSLFPEVMSRLSVNYFTRFSSLYEQGRIRELRSEYQKLFNLGLQCSIFILLSLYFLNETFIRNWVGEDKFIGNDIFIFMLLNIGVLLINSFTGLIVQVSGDFRKTPIFALLEVASLFILTYFLYNLYGNLGVIIGLFLSSLPAFIYTLTVVKTILRFEFRVIINENYKGIIILIAALPIVDFLVQKLAIFDIIKLLIEVFLFFLVFLFTQWNNIPLTVKSSVRRLFKC